MLNMDPRMPTQMRVKETVGEIKCCHLKDPPQHHTRFLIFNIFSLYIYLSLSRSL